MGRGAGGLLPNRDTEALPGHGLPVPVTRPPPTASLAGGSGPQAPGRGGRRTQPPSLTGSNRDSARARTDSGDGLSLLEPGRGAVLNGMRARPGHSLAGDSLSLGLAGNDLVGSSPHHPCLTKLSKLAGGRSGFEGPGPYRPGGPC
jgi:hypothetical protein